VPAGFLCISGQPRDDRRVGELIEGRQVGAEPRRSPAWAGRAGRFFVLVAGELDLAAIDSKGCAVRSPAGRVVLPGVTAGSETTAPRSSVTVLIRPYGWSIGSRMTEPP